VRDADDGAALVGAAVIDLFERAEALGVFVLGNDDLEALLEAVHENEGKLMRLRHAIERRIACIYINESPEP
jgi:hypothetical protein